jgi:hypothetical protein
LRNTEAGTLFNEHLAAGGQTVFAPHAGLVSRESSLNGSTDLSIGTVSGLDQVPQSSEHRKTAGAQRELEQVMGAGC